MSQREELRPAIKRVLELLENVRRGGEGYTALCPAHGDTNNSLSVTETDDGHVLIKCFAGCETTDVIAELGLEWADLFATTGGNGQYLIGLTVEDYAKAKGLRESFLRQLGITQVYINGTPVVRIPYLDPTGVPLSVRMRVSLNGDVKFRWKTGSKPVLYGLWLDWHRESKYIILCEGESDSHTLWFHRFPALGLPGAATWREEWASYLDPYERIYVVIEPDKGGESVLRWLSNSKIRERARLITIAGAKDPSALYLSDRTGFKESWKAVMKAAIPWSERENAENRAKRKEAWAKCKNLARKENILEEFGEAVARRGVAGERRACQVLYLGMTTRFLLRLVSLVFTGPSSAGKSFSVEQTLAFFPANAYYALTAMSERALAYSAEPLSHRFLVLYEAGALEGDFLNYIVRSLMSEGLLRYVTVEKTAEGLQARVIEREGPTGLIMTTTAVSLHPENETRHFVLTMSDSPAQTKRILNAIAAKHSGNDDQKKSPVDMEEWHALQEWLQFANHEVVIPYAPAIAELLPPVAVRLRRDFKGVLNLVEAHTILHQKNRQVDDQGRVMAMLKDYRAVRDLVNPLISQGVELTVSKTIRQTVEAVGRICSKKEDDDKRIAGEQTAASIKDVAKKLGIDRSAASRRISKALQGGYLKNLETKRGQPKRLVIGDPLPEEGSILPTAEEVKAQWKKMRQQS